MIIACSDFEPGVNIYTISAENFISVLVNLWHYLCSFSVHQQHRLQEPFGLAEYSWDHMTCWGMDEVSVKTRQNQEPTCFWAGLAASTHHSCVFSHHPVTLVDESKALVSHGHKQEVPLVTQA